VNEINPTLYRPTTVCKLAPFMDKGRGEEVHCRDYSGTAHPARKENQMKNTAASRS
jgi:hypothetical protein